MSDLKVGDRVRIKDRPDWPISTGYKLANQEGSVHEVLDNPEGYVMVLMDGEASGIDASIPLGFRVEAVDKI